MDTKERLSTIEAKLKVLMGLAKERATEEEQAKLFHGAGEILTTLDIWHERLGTLYPSKEAFEVLKNDHAKTNDLLAEL